MEKPLILRVYVIQGRSLAVRAGSGIPNPFLVATLGRERHQTPYISKTNNPEWDIALDIPLTDTTLLEFVCWNKDHFRKDYIGEFDIAVTNLFPSGEIHAEPKWFELKSRRTGNKPGAVVLGKIQVQFSLVITAKPEASAKEILKQFHIILKIADEHDHASRALVNTDDEDDDSDSTVESLGRAEQKQVQTKSKGTDKNLRKKCLACFRRKYMSVRDHDFHGAKDVSGVVFLEVVKATDLPPNPNIATTSFDCNPFVVAALGRKVMRTRVISHDLNPVWNERMVFQVNMNETGYNLTFSVTNKDNLFGNVFIASAFFSVAVLVNSGPVQDPDTGLFRLPEPLEGSPALQEEGHSRIHLPFSRSESPQNQSKGARSTRKRNESGGINNHPQKLSVVFSTSNTKPVNMAVPTSSLYTKGTNSPNRRNVTPGDSDLETYDLPLALKIKETPSAKHSPILQIKAKFVPYTALRQQFWRALLRQYDADDNQRISKIEMTTMLDTIGSTLKESTIDAFFEHSAMQEDGAGGGDLTFDQAVLCLEDILEKTASHNVATTKKVERLVHRPPSALNNASSFSGHVIKVTDPASMLVTESLGDIGHNASLERTGNNDMEEQDEEEHIINICECPICHLPRLHKRSDAGIVVHIATCASADWRQVNNLVMNGFVTQSQAQRKWYSRVIMKIGYGGYKLGANNANILVQNRITGQIDEERMPVYVRLGIRLLYQALGSREMERKRIKKLLKSLSVKQGEKYDDPASASQINEFIAFHQLDMSEVLLPTSEFKSFNDFFSRALKAGARPCSTPDRPEVIVSPADCRTVVFNTVDDATSIWIKGRDYSTTRLFGDAYPLDAIRYQGGSVGIFRLAPQDYHRFHIPVDGILGTPKQIEGEYYTVNPMAIRSSLDVYGENIRVIVPIDSLRHGRVMCVCVGAMMVGSTVITRKEGERVERAEELGYFKFGGSTILLFFEPGKVVYDHDLVANSRHALETLVRVGMSIGQSPYPDPRKPNINENRSKTTE